MQIKLVIDRFEGDKAILLLDEGETAVNWPRNMLPPEAEEGDILRVQFDRDEEATYAARCEAERLLRQTVAGNRDS